MKNTPRTTSVPSLPNDPGVLKAMLGTLMGRFDALESRSQHFEMRSLRLEMELLKYKKWTYGPRADRLASLKDVAQMRDLGPR